MTQHASLKTPDSITQPAPPASPPPFDSAAIIMYLDTDCFCEGCGYLLRGQPVRREPYTQVIMVRCPECGRYIPAALLATAGRMWLNRLASGLTILWMLLLLAAAFVEMLTIFGMSMGTASSVQSYVEYGHQYQTWQAQVTFVAIMAGIVAAMAFVAAVLSTIVFPHWRWWGYVLFALLKTLLVAAAVAGLWQLGGNGGWRGLGFVAAGALIAVHAPAGLIGVLVGRPLGRALATMTLPRRVRAAVGYLWMADGLPPPHAAPAANVERPTHTKTAPR